MNAENKAVIELLSATASIKEHYQKKAIKDGSYFNIFSILGIERKEVITHSRFIAGLLDPNGSHGFQDEFLRAFLQVFDQVSGTQSELDSSNATIVTEEYHGPIEDEKGGNIDIVIKDLTPENTIIIENKVDAVEQDKQLLRYQNAYPCGKVVFLTKWGGESKQESSKNIKYFRLSYAEHIRAWLEKCSQIAQSVPRIRETIDQYLQTVKAITSQNIDVEMNNDINDLLLSKIEYYEAGLALQKAFRTVKTTVIEKSIEPIIKLVAKELDLRYKLNLSADQPHFEFTNDQIEKLGVKICFSSSGNGGQMINVVFGFYPLKPNSRKYEIEKQIDSLFCEKFKRYSGSGYKNWATLSYLDRYRDWEDLEVPKKIHFDSDRFKETLLTHLQKMKKIIAEIA